jgi:hypothetical protein
MILCVPRSKAYTYQFYLNIILTKQVFLKHTFLVIAAIINNWMHPVKATQSKRLRKQDIQRKYTG